MGSRPKPNFPTPPDPREVAEIQRAYSMVPQENPWFRRSYEKAGLGPQGVQQYREITSLTPEAQRMHDLQTQIGENYLTRAFDAISGHQAPIDFAALPEVTEPDRETYNRVYQGYMDRFRPDIAEEEERRRQQLFSQGFGTGSEVQNQLVEQTNDQLQKLRFGADERAYQRMMSEFGAQRQARNQALQEQIQEYQLNSPLQQLGHIQPFLPANNMMPLASPTAAVPDYMGAQQRSLQQQNAIAQAKFQNAMDRYNKRQGMFESLGTGLGQMFAGPLGGMIGGTVTGGLFGG